MVFWLAGNNCNQLFVVQGCLPQQSQLFHDAADRGTLCNGSSRWRHYSAVLDHQATAKGSWLLLRRFFGDFNMLKNVCWYDITTKSLLLDEGSTTVYWKLETRIMCKKDFYINPPVRIQNNHLRLNGIKDKCRDKPVAIREKFAWCPKRRHIAKAVW